MILYLAAIEPNFIESVSNSNLRAGEEKKNKKPNTLNRRWAIAKLIAACDLKITAKKAVIVVPILAPTMNGITFLSVTFWVATKGTINEVVIELDWTIEVTKAPHAKDFVEFWKTTCCNVFSASPITILYTVFDIILIEIISRKNDINRLKNELAIRL